MESRRRFSTWALGLVVATVLVILWGAWVRVTGSGAGCADHWPLCNGELVPRSPRVETLIELTHRVTSGLAGLLAVAVFWLARRTFARGDPARRAATAALVLMLLEGAIGALLVKKGLVGKDTSAGRAWVVGLHLCNTFLLLGAQVATYQLGRAPQRALVRGQGWVAGQLLLALLGLLVLGASGAVTALGDTLFPAASLAAGVADDLSAEAHFLQKLRVYHPLMAVLVGGFVVYLAQQLRAVEARPAREQDVEASGSARDQDVGSAREQSQARAGQRISRWATRLTLLYLVQVALGSLNLLLLAPALVQVAHLLLADLTWIACVQLWLACADRPALAAR